MSSRLKQAFTTKPLLSVYYTAGFPTLNDTLCIAAALEKSGVSMLEIGFPFSDPVADGPTIQHSSEVALKNGMTLTKLFDDLVELRCKVSIPVLLMGYLNPVLQFGVDRFCKRCQEVGVDGVIIPDLPLEEWREQYREELRQNEIETVFLVTPQTSEQRIREIDQLSESFIYLVSSYAVTGAGLAISEEQIRYFERIKKMKLKNPTVVGFGVSDRIAFNQCVEYADGAIIGSAFIRWLQEHGASEESVAQFVSNFR
jgi:tryptophan synthase alpha chain